jgi:hypothetical protein
MALAACVLAAGSAAAADTTRSHHKAPSHATVALAVHAANSIEVKAPQKLIYYQVETGQGTLGYFAPAE